MKKTNIFRRVFAFCIAFVLCVTMLCTVSVNATDTGTTIALADVVGVNGQEIEVPLVITNNTGLATFRFRVTYNTDALEFLSVEKCGAFTGGTVASTTNPDEQTVTFLWYSLKNITSDGEIVRLRFKIAEGYHGVLPLEVEYRASEILDQNQQVLDCTVNNGSITAAGTFYGNVTSCEQPLANVTIRLLKDGVEQHSVTTTDGSFKIECLVPATYMVQVSAYKYLTETYELVMGLDDAQKDFELLMVGDASHDGKFNGRDYTVIMQYINGWDIEINLDSADVNGDGKISGRDYSLIMQYLNGWDVDIF